MTSNKGQHHKRTEIILERQSSIDANSILRKMFVIMIFMMFSFCVARFSFTNIIIIIAKVKDKDNLSADLQNRKSEIGFMHF